MEEINIKANGIILNEEMRTHILQRLHSVFGFSQYDVQRIVITIFEDQEIDSTEENRCIIEIKIRHHPKIITELKSFDIFTAITLAIEKAKLKVSRRILNKKIIRKQNSSSNLITMS